MPTARPSILINEKALCRHKLRAAIDAVRKITQSAFTLYAKLLSQLSIANHAIGTAITTAININLVNPVDNRYTTLNTEAPNTFLTPISFVRCSAINADKPYNPIQEIKIASIANTLKRLPMRCSP